MGERVSDHPLQDWSFRALGESILPVVATPDGKAVVLIGDIREEKAAPSLRTFGGLLGKPMASFDLLKIAITGDTVLKATLEFEPRPTEPLQDWLRDSFAGVIGGDFGRPSQAPPVPRPVAEQMRAEARAAITWLLRELREDRADLWEIYDTNGNLAGSVMITEGRSDRRPWGPRVEVLRATREEMWGATLDDLDVPTIHRYRIRRAC
jgi:hypothetical protein